MAMIKPITWQLFGHIREGVTFPKITGPPDAFRARYLLRKKAHNVNYYSDKKI